MGKYPSKEEILSKTKGGLLIYKYYLPELIKSGRGFKTNSPFRDDRKPSLTVFYWKDKQIWCYKDQAFPEEYKGDCFKFISQIEGMEDADFVSLLRRAGELCEEMGIELTGEYTSPELEYGNPVEIIPQRESPVLPKTIEYLNKYGLTVEEAIALNMIPVEVLRVKCDCGKVREYKTPQVSFFLNGENGGKFYTPSPKNYYAVYTGGPYRFALGDPLKAGILVYISGEKDAVNFYKQTGIPVVALGSEGVNPSPEHLQDAFDEGIINLVLYDNDDAGARNSKRMRDNYGMLEVRLSEIIPDGHTTFVKDVSDYVEQGLDVGALKDFIIQVSEGEYNPLGVEESEPLVGSVHEPKLAAQTSSSEQDAVESEKPEIPVSTSIQPATPQIERDPEPEIDPESITETDPLIPGTLYDALPALIGKFCSPFADSRDRAVVLLSTLVTLSSIFDRFFFTYRQRYSPCFNAFIVGHSGSGKGLVKFPVQTVKPIQNLWDAEFYEELEKFKESDSTGQSPKLKQLVIPGNASLSGLLSQLEANIGKGIIFETEADSLAQALSQEWGDLSPVIRKMFEHEELSLMRKNRTDSHRIERPVASMLLAGTHDQIPRIVSGVNNGLFSRFAYLVLNEQAQLKNLFDEPTDLTKHFDDLSKDVLEVWGRIPEDDTEVIFSPKQKHVIFDWLQGSHSQINAMYGEAGVSVVHRMAVILLRIASVISVTRALEEEFSAPIVMCIDQDLNSAMEISSVLLKHSIRLMDMMPEQPSVEVAQSTRKQLLQRLPSEFSTKRAFEVGEKLKVKVSSVEKYLKAYIDAGYIERVKKSHYRKL